MARQDCAPPGSWIPTGAALVGLAGVVAYVATGPSSWLAAALLAVVTGVAALVIARSGLDRCEVAVTLVAEPQSPDSPRVLGLAAALGAVATAIVADRQLEQRLDVGTLMAVWLGAIVLLLLAAWWPQIAGAARRPGARLWRATPTGALPWIGMTLAGALPRLAMLDRFPTVLSGDEGSFMVRARAAQRGEMVDVFGPGFFGNPNLYPAMQGWLASVVGTPPADYRILSGLLGTLAVVATWRLGRYLLGPRAAVASAVILATMPLNLQFSRMALNNIADASALVVALLFLLRGVASGRAGDAVVAGLALGFGFYGYFGGRAFPVVLLVTLAILSAGRRVRPREAIRLGSWMAAGYVVTALPLILAFRALPGEFGGRMDTLSPFSMDALARDPVEVARRYLDNLRDAVLAPLVGTPGDLLGFFHNEPPMVGWPLAILLAVGAAVCVARVVRDRNMDLAAIVLVPSAMLLAGVALTVPIASQRLIALTPFYALAAGAGLALLARLLSSAVSGVRFPIGTAVLGVALVAMAVTDLRWFASEDRQIANYGDYRGTMMWDIGWRVDHAPPGGEAPRILFAGPPMVFTGGFNSLMIQAPELVMTDIVEPLGTTPSPVLTDDVMLVIIGERQAERCIAEEQYPSATVAEVHARDGTLLYIALYREPLAGWSMAETPAETTFTVITESPCGS